jgi:hypothetical protein
MQHWWRMRWSNVMMMMVMRRQVWMCAVVQMTQSTAQWSHIGWWHQIRNCRWDAHWWGHVVKIMMIVQVIIRIRLTWWYIAVGIMIVVLPISDQILQTQICVWHLVESSTVHHWKWIKRWKYLLIWAKRFESVLHTFITDFCCSRHLLLGGIKKLRKLL